MEFAWKNTASKILSHERAMTISYNYCTAWGGSLPITTTSTEHDSYLF